jgi:hypothetical protein
MLGPVGDHHTVWIHHKAGTPNPRRPRRPVPRYAGWWLIQLDHLIEVGVSRQPLQSSSQSPVIEIAHQPAAAQID